MHGLGDIFVTAWAPFLHSTFCLLKYLIKLSNTFPNILDIPRPYETVLYDNDRLSQIQLLTGRRLSVRRKFDLKKVSR